MRSSVAALNVGSESRILLQDFQKLSANISGSRFEPLKPGEVIARIKLKVRKSWKKVLARLLKVHALSAAQNVERITKARSRDEVRAACETLAQITLEAPGVLLAHGRRSRNLIAHCGGHFARCRRQVDCRTIERRRRTLVAQCGQLVGLDNKCEQVPRFQTERSIRRGERRRMVMRARA